VPSPLERSTGWIFTSPIPLSRELIAMTPETSRQHSRNGEMLGPGAFPGYNRAVKPDQDSLFKT
jgi:hypothetical protein